MTRWIDVSVPLRNGMPHWPGDQSFEIAREMDFRHGHPMNLSSLRTSAHAGTHMDSPLHFIDGGASIDTFPLEVAVGPARVIGIDDPREIAAPELERHQLRPGERVLFKTRNSLLGWMDREFVEDFVSIAEDAARYLAARKVALVGVDYLSVGAFHGDQGVGIHRVLLGAGVWIIEGLDLSRVAPGVYDMICLPLRIEGAEGAPARVVLGST